MALLLKVNPVGIDRPIDKIQQALYTGLVTNGTWTMYESYHRAYKNETKDGIVPEIFTGKKDYKDAFTDDGFTATSFFLIPDEVGVVEGQKFQAEISIIFQVDLAKLYPNAPDSRRFDEEMHNEILNILNDLDANFTDVDYVTSLDSVYAGLDTSKIKWNDLQPYHVVRFTVTANYDYQCNPVFATAGLVCTIGVDMSKTDPTTPGGSDGTATATPTGGQGVITYLWNDPGAQTTQTATGLEDGTYTCIVTDSIISIPPCNTLGMIELEDPVVCTIGVTVGVTAETIEGANDGTASATPSGGQGTLTYLWTTGDGSIPGGTETNQNITGLSSGTYTVVVTDDIIPSPVCSATDNGTVNTTAIDSDAQAFFTAASITDVTQQAAINNLVIALKADSLWSKMYYIYPWVGGTAAKHSYNLIDPALYQLIFNGGWTHGSTGGTPNGTTGYATTGFATNLVTSINSVAHGFYCRTNQASPAWKVDYGASDAIYGNGVWMVAKNSGKIWGGAYSNNAYDETTTGTQGLLVLSRESSSGRTGYRNAVALATDAIGITSQSSEEIVIGAINQAGTIGDYSDREHSLTFLSDGLTASQETDLDTIVLAYETALSRNV